MSGTIEQKFLPTFILLKAAIEEDSDRNLKNTFEFITEILGSSDRDGIATYFSSENWGETRAELRFAARKKWSNKSTLRGHLSRITKINGLAVQMLSQGFVSSNGSDWQYLTALEEIRTKMSEKKVKSFTSLEKSANGKSSNYIRHLFQKKRKYLPNYSKRIVKRLQEVCDFLELDWEVMRPMLLAEGAQSISATKLRPSAFSYILKSQNYPQSLKGAIQEIENFHMRMTPGRLADGSAKLRTEKSFWKIRESDKGCASQRNFHNLIGSFFGYCTLPADVEIARKLAKERLDRTAVEWREDDFDEYVSWVTGEGMDQTDISISMLFDMDLIERWLNWLAVRNGGISRTQATYCLSLCGLTNGKTGAISQSYLVAAQVLGFPKLPNRNLRINEKEKIRLKMREWVEHCDSASTQFRLLQKAFSSSKVKKRRRVDSRHGKILELKDPLDAVQSLISRLHLSEPLHLSRDSQSWLVWARNMVMHELILSNPLRAENLCNLNYCEDGTGRIRKSERGYEIRLEKHEVKNPHEEKEFGYTGSIGSSANTWLDFYINVVRPLWPTKLKASERLFLTDSGMPISVIELRSIFIRVSSLHLPEFGALNPHAYRHIVATSWLKRNPDDFLTVSLVLGDRIDTVLREYAHLASFDGFSRYHSSLDTWGSRQPPALKGK